MNLQNDLFGPLLAAYASGEAISNDELYEKLETSEAIPPGALLERIPVGKSKQLHNPTRRRLRWEQQTCKALGLLEKVPGQRGVWRSTAKARGELTPAPHRTVLLGFSTKLGLALWGSCADVFKGISEPIHCVLTSPPYCLSRPRAYGGPTEREYVEFICQSLEPLIKLLVPGGTVTLNISNDTFIAGHPARSTVKERLVLALCDSFQLYKVDEAVWSNPSKAPGPIAWASKERFLLNTGYEPILIFTNDPTRLFTSNQRVLQPHSERHLRLIAKGGEQRTGSYGDGANRIKPGAFANPTAGKIPKNVLTFGHKCPSQTGLRKHVAAEGLPAHGATFPLALAKFLVEYLTEPEQVVVDPFSGWFTAPLAAEMTGRRWMGSEKHLQYVEGARYRFKQFEGFSAEHKLAA